MGYIGTKMSERAFEAHQNGEKPYSQWSKEDLLDSLPVEIQEKAKKLTLSELRCRLLHYSSWHHTGTYYNRTDFYEIDENQIDKLTAEKIDEIITNRPKRVRVKKVKTKPLFVTAKIRYTEWEGRFRNYRHPVTYTAVVQFMSDAKMVKIDYYTTKRLSSVEIVEKIEQKTKFADKKRLSK